MATAAQHRAEIDRINTEVAAQAAKIAELSEILDGKAGGGASVETIIVTIAGAIGGTISPKLGALYEDGSYELKAVSVGSTYTIFKDQIVYASFNNHVLSISGNYSTLSTQIGNSFYVFSGDITLTYRYSSGGSD